MLQEEQKWTSEQRATPGVLRQRIKAYPDHRVGAFSQDSGKAIASLFVKQILKAVLERAETWAECAEVEEVSESPTLFGISLTSLDGDAADSVMSTYVAPAVQQGRTELFLGSPVPGLRAWRAKNPSLPVEEYGCRNIEACKPDYSHHE
jgi:hypothetical protein